MILSLRLTLGKKAKLGDFEKEEYNPTFNFGPIQKRKRVFKSWMIRYIWLILKFASKKRERTRSPMTGWSILRRRRNRRLLNSQMKTQLDLRM
jgi:hypothetical protein